MSAKKVIFSGIQPSGNLHIGNYLGMIREMIRLQDEGEVIFMIADLHAITVRQDPVVLRKNITDVAAWLMAAGLDPQRSHMFVQSENSNHSYLAWIFNCILSMGELERMTQFKDKAKKEGNTASVGLFAYPVLQTADVLLYDVDVVPVGEDQIQHVELMREIARRFNKRFGEIFKEPRAQVRKEVARVMSLSHPERKMSKSDNDPSGVLNLTDTQEEVIKKIERGVTDSFSKIDEKVHGRNTTGGVQNLLTLYSALKKISYDESLATFNGNSYTSFKQEVAAAVNERLDQLQRDYATIVADSSLVTEILDQGREFVREKSSKKITDVKKVVGIGR